MAISDDERREVARWAADCAEHALLLYEALAPNDARPREAIQIARAFSEGTPAAHEPCRASRLRRIRQGLRSETS